MDIETIKKKPIKLESKFSTALTYVVMGLLLSSYTLNIGYIQNIQFVISALCLYLGLRLIKNLNTSFKWAYYLSVYLLFAITILNLLELTSPITAFDGYEFIHIFINIILMFSIAIGLNQYVQKHHNISFISFYIFAQVFVLLFQGDNIDIIIFILVCIILFLPIRSLWKCRQEIKASDNDFILKSPKIQSSIFIGGWMVMSLILSMSLPYIWPFFTHSYIQEIEVPSYKRLVDRSTNFETLDNVTVYEANDNQYRIIAEYQEKNIQRKYSFTDIQYNINGSSQDYLYYQPQYITAYDEEGTLAIKDATLNQSYGFFYNDYNFISQRIYQNPLSKELRITVVLTIDKVEFASIEDEEGNIISPSVNFSVNIHKYKYGSLPGDSESLFDHFSINKDGKLDRNQENDIE